MPQASRRTGFRPPDVVLAGLVAVLQLVGTTLAGWHQTGARPLDAGGYLLLAAGPALLLWRRSRAEAVLLGVFAVTLVYRLVDYPLGPVFAALVVAFLTCAACGRRDVAWTTLVGGYGLVVWVVPLVHDEPVTLAGSIAVGAWLLVLAAIGEGIRQRRAAVAASRLRAVEEQRTREEEERRRASDERLDIARELHDVLAHSLSLINVQSGVALELVDRRPEQAREALQAIKVTSREALIEVQAVLDSLRRKGEALPRDPAKGIGDLDRLVARVRAAGLDVDTRVIGDPVPLPPRLDLAAARIVQESLTNVARHAAGARATVTVTYAPSSLRIRVDDDGPGVAAEARSAGGGNGIPGMRERASALGGGLTAGRRPGGGFSVDATLPLEDKGSRRTPGSSVDGEDRA